MKKYNGYMESDDTIVTWCVGHLVTMSYPEVYDARYKKWSFDTLPFLPDTFLYEVIESAKAQYEIVSKLLNRQDVDCIYVCTDSGREGEYIYRLVEQMAGVKGKLRKRVWIDSQTEEEILRGIKEAKDLSEYDALSDAAYLRAKEDYLMGINFSRALTLKYGQGIKQFLGRERCVISVGRVMTCVLGMVVNREREIRNFTKTPFYRVLGTVALGTEFFVAEWKALPGSRYEGSPLLYKENGFKKKEDAEKLIDYLSQEPKTATILQIEKKKESKNPPLLYNLAELQNECSKYFKISPDETLRVIQELYEKKMVTYPRTDARVLSTAVAKEIYKNINGLRGYSLTGDIAAEILNNQSYKNLSKTRYVNDKQITDHYAIIPTGQGLQNLQSLPPLGRNIYEIIVRRFLSIFYPPAVYDKISFEAVVEKEHFYASAKALQSPGYLEVVYQKIALTLGVKEEKLTASFKVLLDPGYMKVTTYSFKRETTSKENTSKPADSEKTDSTEDEKCSDALKELLLKAKKGDILNIQDYQIKEGETSPPKRYTSGSMILAMENAGQLIEDEELRAQIKGSGIGTSATRAEILKKLVNNEYLTLNKKTQVLTPAILGELVYDVVECSMKALLDPKLTASWEKGLTMVAQGTITSEEYMNKLTDFVGRRTDLVKQNNYQSTLYQMYQRDAKYYK